MLLFGNMHNFSSLPDFYPHTYPFSFSFPRKHLTARKIVLDGPYSALHIRYVKVKSPLSFNTRFDTFPTRPQDLWYQTFWHVFYFTYKT